MDSINLNGVEYIKKKGVKKELVLTDSVDVPFEEGESYFFRMVTFHLVGKVKTKTGKFLELENASWIPDSGRFTQAIKDGQLNEVEPVGTAFINTDSVVDAFKWKHKLPDKQK